MAHYELHRSAGVLASPFAFTSPDEAQKHGSELSRITGMKLYVVRVETVCRVMKWRTVRPAKAKRVRDREGVRAHAFGTALSSYGSSS